MYHFSRNLPCRATTQVLVHRVLTHSTWLEATGTTDIAPEIFPVGNPSEHKTPQSLQGCGLRHVHGQETKTTPKIT